MNGELAFRIDWGKQADATGQSGLWALEASSPPSGDKLNLQTSRINSAPTSIKVSYSFDNGVWTYTLDTVQGGAKQEGSLRSVSLPGQIGGSEMTIAATGTLPGTLKVLEVADLSLSIGQGVFETCPAIKKSSDVVITDDFALSGDKKTCQLSQIKFITDRS